MSKGEMNILLSIRIHCQLDRIANNVVKHCTGGGGANKPEPEHMPLAPCLVVIIARKSWSRCEE